MHKELTRYLDTHNVMLELFGQPPMGSLEDSKSREALFEQLASDMSPENIHMDGGATRLQVAQRTAYYSKCWSQLEALHGRTVTDAEVWSWDR